MSLHLRALVCTPAPTQPIGDNGDLHAPVVESFSAHDDAGHSRTVPRCMYIFHHGYSYCPR
jgi:hypothetical protein